MNKSKNKKEVTIYLNYLHPNNALFELCAMNPKIKKSELWGNKFVSKSGIVAGWFHNHKKAATIVTDLRDVTPEGIYVSLNRCKKSLKDRGNGILNTNISRTNDKEIVALNNFLIDIDPKRASGISSTDEEHQAAIKTAEKIVAFLQKKKWPIPLTVDSGNGVQLIYKIDMDNTDQNKFLLKRNLEALGQKFNTKKINIDMAVYNPARLVRLPGSYNRKGENTAKRPHRRAKILSMPKNITPVKTKRLKKLAAMIPEEPEKKKPETQEAPHLLDIKAYLEHYDVEISKIKSYKGGKLYVLKRCPFDKHHSPSKASIFQSSEGTLYYRCLHNSCRDKRWNDFRQIISGDDELGRFYNDLPSIEVKRQIPYSIIDGSELIHHRIKEKTLINGLLEETGSLLLLGQTGMMKSMITLNIALTLANPPEDNRLWGLYDIRKPSNTLFIQSENGIYGTNSRIQLMTKGNSSFEESLKHIYFPNIMKDCRLSGDIREDYFQEMLKDLIFKSKSRLLVIDPLISFHSQNENDNAEVRKTLDCLTKLCDVTKTACLVVHHMGKASSDDVYAGRGASSLPDWASNILVISEGDKGDRDVIKSLNVRHVKSRNFKTSPPFMLDVSSNLQFTKFDSPTEKHKQAVVDILKSLGGDVDDQGTLKQKVAKAQNVSPSTALRLINKAVEDGIIEAYVKGKKKGYSLK